MVNNNSLKNEDVINWLLGGDVSLRYQVLRDLTNSGEKETLEEQRKIETQGWGAKLLSFQEDSGMWGGGLYSPKWVSTHYTLMTLWRLGLPQDNEQAQKGSHLLLDKGFYSDGGINHFKSMNCSETCVTGMTLTLISYFNISDPRIHKVAEYLLDQQMADGGWNCQYYKGAVHGSFHTTINVLEGLQEYQKCFNQQDASIEEAFKRAHEFLLMHHLFRSDKTGAVVDKKMTYFSFPPHWRYDVMRVLDYFQHINMPHDPRFCDAIYLLKQKEKEGRWPLQARHSGRTYFEMEKTGSPSRINTLRALRILNWWRRKPHDLTCEK